MNKGHSGLSEYTAKVQSLHIYICLSHTLCCVGFDRSESGWAADHQAGVEPNQKQSGRPAGEPGAHGERPRQEVG